jgi:hypothetical protein
MHHIKLYLNAPTSFPSITPDSPTWLTNTTHCVNIANILLSPFALIGKREQACTAALLEAIVHKVRALSPGGYPYLGFAPSLPVLTTLSL